MTWAYGKAILLGEHAVVYGHPALAGAIDSRLQCTLTPRRDRGLRLRVPFWGVDVASADEHPLATALRSLIEHFGVSDLGADLEVDTRLPAAAGLGSSAALSVAVVRALGEVLQKNLTDDAIEAAADRAERSFHQNPSGVDVALATRGGLGLFVRGQGLTRLAADPVILAVGLSGQPRRTADMVARVADKRRAEPELTQKQLADLGSFARAGASAVTGRDLTALGALMSSAHRTLADLGVSTLRLDELVAQALDADALGAKLTGAGGGGAVIALADCTETAERILLRWRGRGYDGFVCNAGVSP